MAATVLGNNLTTRVARKDSPRKKITSQGIEWEYRYTQKVGTAVSETIGAEFPSSSGLYIREISFEPQPGGGYETLVISSGPKEVNVGGTPPPVGTIWFEADANPIEIPIQQHLNYESEHSYRDDSGTFHAFLSATDHPGVESFLMPQPTFTRYEILNAFTFSEANIIAAVGTRNSPTGMTSPTANKWLKTRFSIRQSGSVYEKAETWQYASAGWDDHIYS